MRARRRLGWWLAGWLGAPGVASAQQTLVVSPWGDGDHLTIQPAIDAAVDGDTIVIRGATYDGALSLYGRTLTLAAADGEVVTVRAVGMAPWVIEVRGGAHVTLDHLVVDGLVAHRPLDVGEASTAILAGVTLVNGVNADGYAGGNASVWGSSTLSARDSAFLGGVASGAAPHGGNVAVEWGSFLDLGAGSLVQDGQAERGGGVWVGWYGAAAVDGATFLNNRADGYGDNDGGGVCAESGSSLTVNGTWFNNNQAGLDAASSGGAVHAAGPVTIVSESTFEVGQAYLGAGVAASEGLLVVVGSQFFDNGGRKGAGVSCYKSGVCAVLRSRFDRNTVDLSGGAVYAFQSATEVTESTLCQNTAGGAGFGGGIRQDQGSLSLRDVVLANNVAEVDGGAVSVVDAAFTARNDSLLANHATSGGGGAYHLYDTAGVGLTPSVVNDLFVWNTATWDGSVAFGPGDAVTYSLFWGSSPDDGTFQGSATNLFEDPQILGWTPGSCDFSQFGYEGATPVVDAGDPGLNDADGSRSDVGARGETTGDDPLGDADGDGVVNVLDCAADDPNVDWTLQRWYPDGDGDRYGDHTVWVDACFAPYGYVEVGGDCDDANPYLNPETWWFADVDYDGHGDPTWPFQSCYGVGGAPTGDDCDDRDPAVGAPSAWFVDEDRDGYGSDEMVLACALVDGITDLGGDCAPADAGVYPGAAEVCDGADQDCDGVSDDDPVNGSSGHVDADGDGFGDGGRWVSDCDPDGLVVDGTDCDDTNEAVFPGAPDAWYDGVDSDCDGRDDLDQDGDGADKSSDCDDTDPEVFPGAADPVDDGVDGDCDGVESRTWLGGSGCACDGAAGGGAWAGVAAALFVLGRRRAGR